MNASILKHPAQPQGQIGRRRDHVSVFGGPVRGSVGRLYV